jgi:hypothetical protein
MQAIYIIFHYLHHLSLTHVSSLTFNLLIQTIHIASRKCNYYFQYMRNVQSIHMFLFVSLFHYLIILSNSFSVILNSFIVMPNFDNNRCKNYVNLTHTCNHHIFKKSLLTTREYALVLLLCKKK